MTSRMRSLHRLRLRVFAVLTGVVLAAIAALSVWALPAVPVMGVALLTAAAVLNTMTAKLGAAACTGCGHSLEGLPTGAYGAICPGCGAIDSRTLAGRERRVALDAPTAEDDQPET